MTVQRLLRFGSFSELTESCNSKYYSVSKMAGSNLLQKPHKDMEIARVLFKNTLLKLTAKDTDRI
jgi:hypothetical protein